jgi:hypothetical protein
MAFGVDRSSCPSVFDAGLPTIDYEHAQSPDEAHEIVGRAREQAPIALGPQWSCSVSSKPLSMPRSTSTSVTSGRSSAASLRASALVDAAPITEVP